MEDETIIYLEMEDGDTINMVFNQRFTLELLYHCYSIKGILQGVTPSGYFK